MYGHIFCMLTEEAAGSLGLNKALSSFAGVCLTENPESPNVSQFLKSLVHKMTIILRDSALHVSLIRNRFQSSIARDKFTATRGIFRKGKRT